VAILGPSVARDAPAKRSAIQKKVFREAIFRALTISNVHIFNISMK
jgi:hypothetical protein